MTNTEVLIIGCPESANAGQGVNFTVETKNLLETNLTVQTLVMMEGREVLVNAIQTLPPGTKAYYVFFTMPSEDIEIGAYTYYLGPDEFFHFDNEDHQLVVATNVPSLIGSLIPFIVLVMVMGLMIPLTKRLAPKKSTEMLQVASVVKEGNLYTGKVYHINYWIVADSEVQVVEYLRDPLLLPICYPPGRIEEDVTEELLVLGWRPSDPFTDRMIGVYLGLITGKHFRTFRHSRLRNCVIGFDYEGGVITRTYLMRGFMRYG